MQSNYHVMEGKTISGYTIKKRLGVGGMAEVWYAENKIGKSAAVKLLLPELCRNSNLVERFLTEAKTMVMLDHPNIRQVYDYGDIDGCPAIVMEYLDGEDLKARMKHGQRFTDEELIKWWNQLVDALQYTHSKGIIHRDIKPGNIFVDKNGNIKLLDFGIAKVRESISSTQTGQKLGTLMYMSPEQVKDSKHIDYHTDIYSLAVTFVHLVTGRKPYNSDTSSDFEIQTNIVSKPLDLSELPDKWRNFLEPYLNKEASQRPELRYFDENAPAPTPKPVANDEATVYDEGPAKPEPVAKPEPPKKTENIKPVGNSPKKNKTGLWISLGIVAVAAVVVFVFMSKSSDSSSNDKTRSESSYETEYNPEEEAYWMSVNIDDYYDYLNKYGPDSKYYNEEHYNIILYVIEHPEPEVTDDFACDTLSIQPQPQPQPKPQPSQQIQIVDDYNEVEDVDIIADWSEDEYVDDYWETDIEEEEVFMSVEENPEFPGGTAALLNYVQQNLKYPMQARESDIQGRVFVGFIVEKDGSLSNVEVLRGIGGGCDEEAVRVVKSLPKFKPGKQRGAPVRVRYTLPIVFQLQ